MSNNNLSGFLPFALEEMYGLSYVDISYNNLEVPLPNSKVFQHACIEEVKGNKGVRTYVIHLLGTYVTILCNWLIL